jgi:hypothetical protein
MASSLCTGTTACTGKAATGVAFIAFHALNSSSSSLSLNNFLALLARFPSFENDPDFDPAFEPDADGSSVSPAGLSSSAGSSSSVVESAAPMLLLFCLPPLGSLDCAASSFF